MLAIFLAFAVSIPSPPPAATHPREFWRGVVAHDYEPPAGSDVPALASELSLLLGSPDPELRDEIGYTTLTTWIYQKRIIGPDALRPLADQWIENLRQGIGERETDGIFRRSFSALMLSLVIARDNAAPFLSEAEFKRVENAALAYLDSERDVRGYEPTKGWMHSAAHTADLLKFIGRGRYLDRPEQARLLGAIANKLAAVPVVLTFGEDERFARAILSLVNRPDFDREGFRAWVLQIRPGRPAARPTLAELASAQNTKNLFAKLEALLALDPRSDDALQSARDSVRAALKDLF